MLADLDERSDLVRRISLLSVGEVQKLSIFLSGMEAGKAAQATEAEPADEQADEKT